LNNSGAARRMKSAELTEDKEELLKKIAEMQFQLDLVRAEKKELKRSHLKEMGRRDNREFTCVSVVAAYLVT
jgi:hypothetical protein